MPPSTTKWAAALLLASLPPALPALEAYAEPDTLILKDGTSIRGTIVRNAAKEVVVQEEFGETTVPKSEIVRIIDLRNAGMEFTAANRPGDLPPWRIIVNDLRLNDAVRSLEQIPATAIDNGLFKNVPYMSFRVNELMELNIYGDPEDPAAVEFGIYGRRSGDDRLRRTLRSFLAGFLSSRESIAALYALPFSGGSSTGRDWGVSIIPKSAPDSYGGWWINLYNPRRLEAARLGDAEYAALTRPFGEIVGKGGHVRRGTWADEDIHNSVRLRRSVEEPPVFLRGFYRDAQGNFRPVTSGG